MKIIKFSKLKDNRYNVMLENDEVLKLYDDVIIKYDLVRTKLIDDSLLDELVKYNDSLEAYYNAVKYITKKLRCELELKKYLSKKYDDEVLEQVEINHKYEGYISKAKKEAEKMIKLGEKQIPEDIDYKKVDNLATEARQKLEKVRPRTIEQATRISGVNPSDIAILMVYLKRYYNA